MCMTTHKISDSGAMKNRKFYKFHISKTFEEIADTLATNLDLNTG